MLQLENICLMISSWCLKYRTWNFWETNLFILSKTLFTWGFTCPCWRRVLFFLCLISGWIINLSILACHRYSEWKEGSDNILPRAFWTSLWWHECELRHSHFLLLCCMYVFLLRCFSLYPSSPARTQSSNGGNILNICNTAVWNNLHPPRVTLCNFWASRKCFQFILLRPFMSNSKWSSSYLRASHRGICDTDNNLKEKITCVSVTGFLWIVVPCIQS